VRKTGHIKGIKKIKRPVYKISQKGIIHGHDAIIVINIKEDERGRRHIIREVNILYMPPVV
jgi:hypothetical protein